MTVTSTEVRGRTPAAPARRRRRRPSGRRLAPYVFVLPFVALFLAFSVYPLIYTFRLSFTAWSGSGPARWAGWDNYTYLLGSDAFWSSLANSAVLWLLIVPVQVVVALLAAVLLNNAKLRMRGFYRTVALVPFVTPLVAMAQIWIVVFDADYGAVNQLLGAVGLPEIDWLTSTFWAKPTLALLFLWKTTGFAIVILLSGLQSIPASVYEAAELDGASRTRQLVSITVPLVRRVVLFLVVMQTLAVFQMFAEPYVVTGGGPYGSTTTAGLYLYDHLGRSDLGTGSANSFLLVAIVMLVSLLFVRLLRERD
ncbi:carbohydrate ABC transporter permease [Jiangella alkaliphila]|uniref:Carbohydrate ABC transporter membrane protein 1, CUT1 family n=1 Tax=Jiangella alkaliphila TaxID=419479 RepID=A0A1H2IRQ3_9ACTN|nr:sugar ABC transporter permease [Jiangella alkaliphila]SDU46566.1 carbohydrate ABC transporter membrane protein 1, CUT1 family [Jiangella alkaliphila]